MIDHQLIAAIMQQSKKRKLNFPLLSDSKAGREKMELKTDIKFPKMTTQTIYMALTVTLK